MNFFRTILVVFFILSLSGCVMDIDSSIARYDQVKNQVNLGDSKNKVLAVLSPAQEDLSNSYKKDPEKYIKDGVRVEIYYFRSDRQPDGLTTDDEFTPYLFNDGILVGVGWTVLGGPKTQGQTSDSTYISNDNTVIVY